MRKFALFVLILSSTVLLYGNGRSRIAVFFTDSPSKTITQSTPLGAFLTVVNSSQKSIYGAFFEIKNMKAAEALVAAHKRGVKIALVSDSDYENNRALQYLVRSGIPVRLDGRKALMHNKFAVIDGRYVWTGSFNLTDNCAYKNNNNALLIDSPDLACIYYDEFSEMFDRHIFGNRKDDQLFPFTAKNRYYVDLDGIPINAYFSPDNDVEDVIVGRLKKAKSSIYFMAFSFTSKRIAEAMIKRKTAGVAVAGIFEKKGSKTPYSQFVRMRTEGMDVRTVRGSGVMHNKVIVIDDEIVITGSYNFTANASRRNDENILIIQDKDLAAKYIREYKKIRR